MLAGDDDRPCFQMTNDKAAGMLPRKFLPVKLVRQRSYQPVSLPGEAEP